MQAQRKVATTHDSEIRAVATALATALSEIYTLLISFLSQYSILIG